MKSKALRTRCARPGRWAGDEASPSRDVRALVRSDPRARRRRDRVRLVHPRPAAAEASRSQERYAVNAEFAAATGLVPGLGQPVNVAGVKVGQVADVDAARRPRASSSWRSTRTSCRAVFADARARARPAHAAEGPADRARPGQARADGRSRRAGSSRSRGRPADRRRRAHRARSTTTRASSSRCSSPRATAGWPSAGRICAAILKSLRPTAEHLRAVTRRAEGSGAARCATSCTSSRSWPRRRARVTRELAELVDSGDGRRSARSRPRSARCAASVRDLPETLAPTRRSLDRAGDVHARSCGPALRRAAPGGAPAGPGAGRRSARWPARRPADPAHAAAAVRARDAPPLARDLRGPTVENLVGGHA